MKLAEGDIITVEEITYGCECMTAKDALKKYFGYDSFRQGQESLIDHMLAGRDVLGIMPTGAGESMCFQIPALLMEGIAIVVSPLISLMKDQVNALTQAGIPGAFINSSLTDRQVQKALYNAANGAYKLIYTAPERLLTPSFLAFAKQAKISMVTVDEAHCISQWGQDFRPSYTEIPEFVAHLKNRPVVSAFTATATPTVRDDIIRRLALENPALLVSGFDRPNLFFDIQKPKDKFSALSAFLSERSNLSGIVYCSTRNAVEEVCEKLKEKGYKAARYHAGLADHERHSNQDDFLHDRVQIMVATNAFGMGIDKSNVSFVVHYNMPMNLEGYYQEAGRAGRDGEPAHCLLLYGKSDVNTNLWIIENSGDMEYPDKATEDAVKQSNIKRLHEMDLYCATADCLRGYILEYFGENITEKCNYCANCEVVFTDTDVTEDVQKIISCVVRMKERYGVKLITDVLRGKNNAKTRGFRLDKLSTFGISNKTAPQLEAIISHMILEGYLIKTADRYPIIKLGARVKEALEKDACIIMKISEKPHAPDTADLHREGQKPKVSVNPTLLESLKSLRAEIAKNQNLPAFVIFHDSTLTDMCMKLPATPDEFLDVSGIGKVKAERYGAQFLAVIEDFVKTNNMQPPSDGVNKRISEA